MSRQVIVFGNNVSGALDPADGAQKILYEPQQLQQSVGVTWAGWTGTVAVDETGKEKVLGLHGLARGDGDLIKGYDDIHGYLLADRSVRSVRGATSGTKGWKTVTVLGSGEVYALTLTPTTLHRFDTFTSFLEATELPTALSFPPLPDLHALTLHPGPSNLILQHPLGIWACGDARHGVTGSPGGLYEPIPVQLEHLEGLHVTCIALGGLKAAAVTDAGEAFIWGKAIEGIQSFDLPGDDDEQRDIKLVGLGSAHEVLVTEQNEVWVKGSRKDKHGQLGLGKDVPSEEAFVRHPFFAALPEGHQVVDLKTSRWATYITVALPEA